MKIPLLCCLASLVLATSAISQTPTASAADQASSPSAAVSTTPTTTVLPITTAPAAIATISPTSTPGSEIEQSIRKKQKRHFNFTIGDHETDADHGKSSEDIPEQVFAIVGITMLTVFGAPVLIVAVIMYFSFSKTRALHHTVRLLVEKGQPIPAALLAPSAPAQRQRSDLRRGTALAMIGIGLMIFLGAVNDWEGGAWSIGIIPFLIGAGYLLVWKLEGKKDNAPPVT
jgi:hypothetical protein